MQNNSDLAKNTMAKYKFLQAFTLAEILITLLIIGVVASLVIPNIINDAQNAELKTAWKKAFADFSQASRSLAQDNGGSLIGVFSSDDDMRNKLANYLPPLKKCEEGSAVGLDGCWPETVYNLSGTVYAYWTLSSWSRMVLNNGMLIAMANMSTPCTYDRAANDNGCGMIAIDINGFKGPNTVGKDIYFNFITANGNFEPFGKQGDYWITTSTGCDLDVNSTANGYTCAAKYLYQ
jgi:prepilin-type N-terminal cleavage/methylation domain-containing protein